MTFKVGDKVRCVDDYGVVNITRGSEYKVIDVSGSSIRILDDNGGYVYYNSSRFELVQEDKLPQSQTKQLSKPIRSCEHNGSIYKEDTIDGVSIEEMKATRDNINSKLLTHRNLFTKKK